MMEAIRITTTLLKLRISFAIAMSALVGMLAADGAFSMLKATVFALAVLGAAGAVSAFNHYYERAGDRLMVRTRGRPFALGTLKPSAIWPITFLGLLVASLAMAAAVGGTLAAVFVFLGAFTYGIVYTVWLKRRSVWNIVVGGAAGSFAILAGAAVVEPTMQATPILLAIVMFLWTPPHFWSLAAAKGDDYRNAGVPMLPNVVSERVWTSLILGHTVLLAVLSLVPLAFGMGPVYGIFAAVGGGLFAWRSWQLFRAPSHKTAYANFKASLIQFSLLTSGVFVDTGIKWAF